MQRLNTSACWNRRAGGGELAGFWCETLFHSIRSRSFDIPWGEHSTIQQASHPRHGMYFTHIGMVSGIAPTANCPNHPSHPWLSPALSLSLSVSLRGMPWPSGMPKTCASRPFYRCSEAFGRSVRRSLNGRIAWNEPPPARTSAAERAGRMVPTVADEHHPTDEVAEVRLCRRSWATAVPTWW